MKSNISDQIYFEKAKGFLSVSSAAIPKNALLPKFKECAKHLHMDEMGCVLYYASQCPFHAKYIPVIENIAKEKSVRYYKRADERQEIFEVVSKVTARL